MSAHLLGAGAEIRVGGDTTGPDGSFALRFEGVEGAVEDAALWVAATYQGVVYSAPRVRGFADSVPEIRLTVYDTVVVRRAPESLQVPVRRLFVRPSGHFRVEVLDVLELENPSTQTWVPAGRGALWNLTLPRRAEGAHVADPGALRDLRLAGDTLRLAGPLVPGHSQVILRYFLPAEPGAVHLPLGAPTAELEVLIAEDLGGKGGAGLAGRGSMRLDRDSFRRFAGRDLEADEPVSFSIRSGFAASGLWLLLPPLLFLALVAGAALWHDRRPPHLAAGSGTP